MMPAKDLWLGVDTGGTYTDAVLLRASDQHILATAKSLTHHHHLAKSLGLSIQQILEQAKPDPKHIALVSISTTLATNAIVEGKGDRVCALLIGYDADMAQRARLSEWHDPFHLIKGGHDGYGEEKAPLDREKIKELALRYQGEVDAFAISSLFSVRNNSHELQAKEIVQSQTGLPVTCGHELTSRLDAPRRALTTALNARLIPRLRGLIEATRSVMKAQNIDAPLMVVRGDGSLLPADEAILRPVETILSGPAASLIGMQFLTGLNDMVMADIGGTTTDIAILQQGRPKLSESGAEIGGYRTMIRAIDVHSYGLGGDSEILLEEDLRLGPRRAVPVSLLALSRPEILESLERQREEDMPAHPARFVLKPDMPNPSFRNQAEKRLYEALPLRPVALHELALGPSSFKALNALASRGVLFLAGPTPSDALHLLGKQDTWSKEAAALAMALAARHHDKGLSAEGFARLVIEHLVAESAKLLLSVALDQPLKEEDFASSLIEAHAKNIRRHRFVDYSFQLTLPLAAAGAAAKIYYPEIAKRLGADLHLSPYASTANAIGAAIGAIVSEIEILVTQPKPGFFRLHLGDQLLDCGQEEEAIALAKEKAREKAYQTAIASGADKIETTIHIEKKEIERGHLLEARIVARATSRPFIDRFHKDNHLSA